MLVRPLNSQAQPMKSIDPYRRNAPSRKACNVGSFKGVYKGYYKGSIRVM